jgi:CrcB protein
MTNIFFILIGGSAGVLSRYFFTNFVNNFWKSDFLIATIIINLIGSFIMGAVSAYADIQVIDPKLKDMLTVGFLGCFTTFSTFSVESLRYLNNSEYFKAGANILISNLGGLIMVAAGYYLVKYILNR